MAYKRMQMTFSEDDAPRFWPEQPSLLNGGLNLVDKEYKLPENQSNNIKNMWFYNGETGIRWGQDWLKSDETVETPAFASYESLYQGYIIKHCGTKLYKQDPTTGVNTVLYSGLAAKKGSFFTANNKLYYKQQGKYIVCDGVTAADVTFYTPTVVINRTPTGGGNTNEQYNRPYAGFINSFNSDGTATAYTLTDTNLDATPIVASIDYGVTYDKVETTHFTVNRTTGVVTWSTPPPAGTNRTKIKAFKTVQSDIDSVMNCTQATKFGGANNFLTYLASNGTGYYYRSGVSTAGAEDPTYFPYNNYNIVGSTDDNITVFVKSYDVLTIHKKSGEIFGETYRFDGTKGIFNTYSIASRGACDCPFTMEVANNYPVWLNSKLGTMVLVGTAVESQRNVFPISRNVNPRLLKEANLTDATGICVDGKYWLCVNDKVYLWDYFQTPYVDTGNPEESAKRLSWWYFDNINAGAWVQDFQDLYYINRASGKTVKFHIPYDNGQFFDFGGMITAVYRYPFRLMGGGVYEFSVINGWVNVRGDIKTAYKVIYFTSDDFNGDPATEDINVGSFSLKNFTLTGFTLKVTGPLTNYELSPYVKNIRYFGVEFHNTAAGCDMNISGMVWQYMIGKLIR